MKSETLVQDEAEILELRCHGTILDSSPGSFQTNQLYIKVIAHELSKSLCTLRLANVYDLSSVSMLYLPVPEYRQAESGVEDIPPKVCQAGPASADDR